MIMTSLAENEKTTKRVNRDECGGIGCWRNATLSQRGNYYNLHNIIVVRDDARLEELKTMISQIKDESDDSDSIPSKYTVVVEFQLAAIYHYRASRWEMVIATSYILAFHLQFEASSSPPSYFDHKEDQDCTILNSDLPNPLETRKCAYPLWIAGASSWVEWFLEEIF